jgi:hypothetical protein
MDFNQTKSSLSQSVASIVHISPDIRKKKKKKNKPLPVIHQGPLNSPPPVIYQKRIIINTSMSEYPLIDKVAKEVFGWRVSKEEDFKKGDFDLWWSDLAIDGHTLQQLKCYQKVNHFPTMY